MSGALPANLDEAALLDLARALKETGYHFATVTPATHERVNARPGNAWARDDRARSPRDVFGWSRPFRGEALPPRLLDLARRAGVLAPHGEGWRSRVRFSSLDGELFVHSAFPTDAADAVFLGPDTARLVEAVLAHVEDRRPAIRRAVDIGCGTGAGAIALAKRAPRAEVIGVDVNPAALRATQLNARLAGTANVAGRPGDVRAGLDGAFDLILSNPPFMVDEAERAYRHGGGPHGVGLPLACVDAAVEHLAPGGALVLFTGAMVVDGRTSFRDEAARRLDAAGLAWDYREVDPDVYGEELDRPGYAEADRIALAVLTATRPA